MQISAPLIRNIYFCLTPYHLLTTILHVERSANDIVVLLDQKGELKLLFDKVRKLGFFGRFYYIDSSSQLINAVCYLTNGRVGKYVNLSRVLLSLDQEVYRNFYFYNDLSPEVQFFLKKLNYENGVYIEDGSAPYNTHFVKRWKVKSAVLTILFRHFYEQIEVLGTSRHVSYGLYSWPKCVREENMRNPCRILKYCDDFVARIEKLSATYRDEFVHNVIDEEKYIAYLPWGSLKDEVGFIHEIREYLKKNSLPDLIVVAKRHPLSQAEDLAGDSVPENVYFCKKEMPGELVPSVFKNIKLVFGRGSTSLMTVRKLHDDLPVISLLNEDKDRYDFFLEDLGVMCHTSSIINP